MQTIETQQRTQTVNKIDRVKENIRRLVAEINELAKSDISEPQFFEAFLDRVVRSLSAQAAVLWMLNDSRTLELKHQIKLHQTVGYLDETADAQHRQLLLQTFETAVATAVSPHSTSGDDGLGNPTDCLVLLQPLVVNGECIGLVEVFHEPKTNPRVRDGYLKFLAQTSELLVDFLRNQRLNNLAEQQSRWQQLEALSRALHSSLNPRTLAYTAVNDIRTLLDADRVSIAIRTGRQWKLEAISGQDVVSHRSNIVKSLVKLVKHAAETGESLVFDTVTFATSPTEDLLGKYAEDNDIEELAIIPMCETSASGWSRETSELASNRPNSHESGYEELPYAALIVENFEATNTATWLPLANQVAQTTSVALQNALQHDRIFLRPLWSWLASGSISRTRTLPMKSILTTLLLIVVSGFLALYPAEFRVEANGELMPQTRREVFAGVDGEVESITVQHGQKVKRGDVLVTLENEELKRKLESLTSDLTKVRYDFLNTEAELDARDISSKDRARVLGTLERLKRQEKNLTAEQKLLERQLERLTITSPIDGFVMTWDPKRKLANRPVQQGQRLLTIADDEAEWGLEVHMDETHSGHVLTANNTPMHERDRLPELSRSFFPEPGISDFNPRLAVDYVLANQPEDRFKGRLTNIAERAEVTGEDGSTVKLTVAISKDESTPLRAGSQVRAYVHCGQRPIGYVWFHELIEFYHARIRF